MNLLLSPGFWLAIVLGAIALFSSGVAVGNRYASSKCLSAQTKAQQASQTAADETDTRREQVAQSREVSRERIRVVYKTIQEKADETIPHLNDCSLDADGLREWNAANTGSLKTLRGEPDYRLSSASKGTVRASGRLAAEPHRGDGALHPMPGSAP